MTISSIIRPIIGSVITPIVGEGFLPSDLPNLAIWLDALDISTLTFNSSTIVGWRNKGNVSGVANAAQATALRQPLYVANAINGRPALRGRHDGTNASQLAIADSAGLDYTTFTIYAVYRRAVDTGVGEFIAGKYPNDATNQREIMSLIGLSDTAQLNISTNGTTAGATFLAGSVVQTVDVPRILRFQYTGTQMQVQTVGQTQATLSYSLPVFQGNAPFTFFSRPPSFDLALAGDIGEFLFFTRSLSSDERTLIENSLRARWGIA